MIKILAFEVIDELCRLLADLEKASSGASGAYGHFAGNPNIFRTFSVKYHVLLADDYRRRFKDNLKPFPGLSFSPLYTIASRPKDHLNFGHHTLQLTFEHSYLSARSQWSKC